MVKQLLLLPLKPPVRDDRVGVPGCGVCGGWAQRGASLDDGINATLLLLEGILTERVEGVHAGS